MTSVWWSLRGNSSHRNFHWITWTFHWEETTHSSKRFFIVLLKKAFFIDSPMETQHGEPMSLRPHICAVVGIEFFLQSFLVRPAALGHNSLRKLSSWLALESYKLGIKISIDVQFSSQSNRLASRLISRCIKLFFSFPRTLKAKSLKVPTC